MSFDQSRQQECRRLSRHPPPRILSLPRAFVVSRRRAYCR